MWPRSSSPILPTRPRAGRGIRGPISPPTQSRPDLPGPPTLLSQGKEPGPPWPPDSPGPRPLSGPLGIVPIRPQAWAKPGGMGRWQAGTVWAGFTAWPARLLVLRRASCRICPIIWTVEFNSHCVLTRSPANITGRHPLHASRPLPSHTAHPYSKLKI